MKSSLHRFFIDFRPPWNLKNRAPAYTRIEFCTFYTSRLKFAFGLDLGRQMAFKIEPKRLQIPYRSLVKICVKLNVNLEANLG